MCRQINFFNKIAMICLLRLFHQQLAWLRQYFWMGFILIYTITESCYYTVIPFIHAVLYFFSAYVTWNIEIHMVLKPSACVWWMGINIPLFAQSKSNYTGPFMAGPPLQRTPRISGHFGRAPIILLLKVPLIKVGGIRKGMVVREMARTRLRESGVEEDRAKNTYPIRID